MKQSITIILLSFFITSCATQSHEKTTNKTKTKDKKTKLVKAYYYGADVMDARN